MTYSYLSFKLIFYLFFCMLFQCFIKPFAYLLQYAEAIIASEFVCCSLCISFALTCIMKATNVIMTPAIPTNGLIVPPIVSPISPVLVKSGVPGKVNSHGAKQPANIITSAAMASGHE